MLFSENCAQTGSVASRPALLSLVFMLAALALGAGSMVANGKPSGAAILSRIRDSINHTPGAPQEECVLLQGEAVRYGDCCSYSLLIDHSGRFLERLNGQLSSSRGYDGSAGWARDWTGTERELPAQELEMLQAFVAILSGRWLDPDSPFEVELDDSRSSIDAVGIDLRLPGNNLGIALTVDRSSWLPRSLETTSSDRRCRWSFEDYHRAQQRMLPHRVTHSDDQSHNVEHYRIQRVTSPKNLALDTFHPDRPDRRDDTCFQQDQPAEVTMKVTPEGHMLVRPQIDGRQIGWFLFDMTALLAISPAAADSVEMPAFGTIALAGLSGENSRFRQAQSFELGQIRLEKPVLIERDLSFLTLLCHEPVVGICGYDLVARSVVEFTPGTGRLALRDPATYPLEGAQWHNLHLDGRYPIIPAVFEGQHEGLFRLDTAGLNETLAFSNPAVTGFDLLEDRITTAGTVIGASGVVQAKLGTLLWFELAGHRFENIVASFDVCPRSGPRRSHPLTGTIGLKMLEPFQLVLNFPRGKIAFLKRVQPSQDTTSPLTRPSRTELILAMHYG